HADTELNTRGSPPARGALPAWARPAVLPDWRRASAGGAPAPRRPAARTSAPTSRGPGARPARTPRARAPRPRAGALGAVVAALLWLTYGRALALSLALAFPAAEIWLPGADVVREEVLIPFTGRTLTAGLYRSARPGG